MAAELPLERGDVLLKIGGRTVEELLEERKQYVSYSREETAIYRMWDLLLYCEGEKAEVTILRGEEELTVLCTSAGVHMIGILYGAFKILCQSKEGLYIPTWGSWSWFAIRRRDDR